MDWTEGVGTRNTGNPALAGETTWNYRNYPSVSWSAPGGVLSNDFSPTVSASLFIAVEGSYTFESNSNLVADVQHWLIDPKNNFGWELSTESEDAFFSARRFGSREDLTNSPLLNIEYANLSAPEIQWIKAVADDIEFSFVASGGQPYTVQYRSEVASGSWLTLTNVPPQLTATNAIVVDFSPIDDQRFYRISAP